VDVYNAEVFDDQGCVGDEAFQRDAHECVA
jgi:hypothetical protein